MGMFKVARTTDIHVFDYVTELVVMLVVTGEAGTTESTDGLVSADGLVMAVERFCFSDSPDAAECVGELREAAETIGDTVRLFLHERVEYFNNIVHDCEPGSERCFC